MIRAVCGSDWSRLEQLWLEVVGTAHPSLPRSYWEGQLDRFRESCLKQENAWVYQEADSQEADGFVALCDDEVVTLFVAPEARDRGAGSALLARAKQGHPLLRVELLEENLEARYFCQKHQFEETDREACTETGQDKLTMELRCG